MTYETAKPWIRRAGFITMCVLGAVMASGLVMFSSLLLGKLMVAMLSNPTAFMVINASLRFLLTHQHVIACTVGPLLLGPALFRGIARATGLLGFNEKYGFPEFIVNPLTDLFRHCFGKQSDNPTDSATHTRDDDVDSAYSDSFDEAPDPFDLAERGVSPFAYSKFKKPASPPASLSGSFTEDALADDSPRAARKVCRLC